MDPIQEDALLKKVEDELRTYTELGLTFREDPVHAQKWNERFRRGRRRFITDAGQIDRAGLKNFRQSKTFFADRPISNLNALTPANLLLGSRRGERELLRRLLVILQEHGYVDLLHRYPPTTIGNPCLFEHKGLRYTHRWIKHIYALGRFKELLAERLETGFTGLDIGGGYGIFQGLLHQEYAACHQVIVDLPEPLLLARYFLGASFPEARIAGVMELSGMSPISRELIEEYDFVLLPTSWYDRLEAGATDVVTSFACLGELKREFFEYYVRAPVFESAKFLFTINPVTAKSFIFKDSDVTILDYPIWEPDKKLYFELCPVYSYPYGRPAQKFIVSYELHRMPPFFEYVGVLSHRGNSD